MNETTINGNSTRIGAIKRLGGRPNGRPDGLWDFTAWAPRRKSVRLHLLGDDGGPASTELWVPMDQDNCGYFHAEVPDADGRRYMYQLDGDVERPDPASRFQPEGVHGPSQAVDL